MNEKLINLQKLLQPRHIVFIGSKGIIEQGIENCKKINFQGDIYCIHQKETSILGIRCYKSVHELPKVPDAAFVAVRAEIAVEIIEQLNQLGVHGAVCYAAGFREIGNEELHHQLIQKAGNMAIVGPNCYGLINYLDYAPLWPDRFGSNHVKEGVAIISQSGNLSFNITMNDRDLPISYIIDVGNQASLDISDYILALAEDERVTAIGLHIEGLNDIEKFIKAAYKALEKQIPIVAFKTGISELGSELTMSHTSSLAGSDDLYNALFKRLNISRVNSLTAFLETLKLFSITGSLNGRNIGVLTVSGGESAIVADIADKNNFTLPKLTENQIDQISLQMSGFENVGNPLDYNTSIWGNRNKLIETFTHFIKDQFDTSLLIIDYLDKKEVNLSDWETVIDSFIHVSKNTSSKSVVISVLPEGMPSYFRKKLMKEGITPLQGITDAFEAMNHAATYHERTKQHHLTSIRMLSTNNIVTTDKSIILNEWEGKQKLKSYGVEVPKGIIVSPQDSTYLHGKMSPPFVVKALSSEIVHKTDVGGVTLNVKPEEIKEVIQSMYHKLSKLMGTNMSFLVEEMVSKPVAELNIGVKRDDQFGLSLIISMGGELVNLLEDSVPLLLPTNRTEIKEAILSLKGAQLLQGFRGRPNGDIEAVINTTEAICSFVDDYKDYILEMDVNPLLVLPEGEGVIAVDSFIRMVPGYEQLQLNKHDIKKCNLA